MRLRRFPAQQSRRKEAGKYVGKKTMVRVFETTFLLIFSCYLDGSSKVLKLLCDVCNEDIFKMQKIVQATSSRVLRLFGRSM